VPEQLPEDPSLLERIALEVAAEAADLVRARRSDGFGIDAKSNLNDVVTDLDRASDALIRERLLALRPRDGIITEEDGPITSASGVVWVADPIDGTTNFCYGLAPYAVSIAATVDGEPIAGAVVEIAFDQRHAASLGNGARCNGRELRLGPCPALANALVGTGYGYDPERRVRQAEVVGRIIDKVRDLRRHGAASYDLCSVAASRLDAYYEHGLCEWDMAAGRIIATEAGAAVEAIDGGRPRPVDGIIAAQPDLIGPLRDLLVANGVEAV